MAPGSFRARFPASLWPPSAQVPGSRGGPPRAMDTLVSSPQPPGGRCCWPVLPVGAAHRVAVTHPKPPRSELPARWEPGSAWAQGLFAHLLPSPASPGNAATPSTGLPGRTQHRWHLTNPAGGEPPFPSRTWKVRPGARPGSSALAEPRPPAVPGILSPLRKGLLVRSKHTGEQKKELVVRQGLDVSGGRRGQRRAGLGEGRPWLVARRPRTSGRAPPQRSGGGGSACPGRKSQEKPREVSAGFPFCLVIYQGKRRINKHISLEGWDNGDEYYCQVWPVSSC